MAFIISQISVAQAATVINAVIMFIQHTLSLSLAILLIFFMPKINPAITWNSIGRALHSTLWPTIFRMDSNHTKAASAKVSIIMHLATISTILIPIAGVTFPLGLRVGPLLLSSHKSMTAEYIPDLSALGLVATPNRHEFRYGRACGENTDDFADEEPVSCPGKNDPHDTSYPPSIIEKFNSTPHSPFSMQFRRFYNAAQNISNGELSTFQSLILRNDTFAIEGLIVDMSLDHPGVGFWNHTVPNVTDGGAWSQDVLWLEPVTECVDTNLTIDYLLNNGPNPFTEVYNLTDRGGFFRLTHDAPPLNRDGQHLDLRQRAYKGAAYSNIYAMRFFNATRETSFYGKTYLMNGSFVFDERQGAPDRSSALNLTYLNASQELSFESNPPYPMSLDTSLPDFYINEITGLPLAYFNGSASVDLRIICEGFGGADIANITNIYVACGGFLGVPRRTDGGDLENYGGGSAWTQKIHICASATRASIQTTTFSTNNTSLFQNLRASRQPANATVLWAVEKANMNIQDVDLMWGRVDDKFEDDPSLWTIRSDHLYLPAGSSSFSTLHALLPRTVAPGQPLTVHATAWNVVYDVPVLGPERLDTLVDYTGSSDYAMLTKFRTILEENPDAGGAQIRNLIWTDIVANNVVGTQTNTTLLVAHNQKSIEYDFKFAIPGLILLVIWVPAFVVAIALLATRLLTFGYMQKVLHHTSVGRVAVKASALRVAEGQNLGGQGTAVEFVSDVESGPDGYTSSSYYRGGNHPNPQVDKYNDKDGVWATRLGAIPVMLDLNRRRTTAL